VLCRVHDFRFDCVHRRHGSRECGQVAQVMCAVCGIVSREEFDIFVWIRCFSLKLCIFVWTQGIRYLCVDTGDSVSLFGYDLQMCLLTCECQQIASVAPWGGVSSAG
jgi:hypothetical protein